MPPMLPPAATTPPQSPTDSMASVLGGVPSPGFGSSAMAGGPPGPPPSLPPLNPGDPHDPMAPPPPTGNMVERKKPEPPKPRRELVNQWQSRVVKARDHWEKLAFEQMRKDMRLTRGDQWGDAAQRQNAQLPPDIFT